MLCVCVGDVMDVVFSVCIVRCGAVGGSCMGSVSVSSCRCCMFVSCVHPVAVLNAAFCMTCSLLMLVEDAIGDHTEEAPNDTAYKRWSCHSGLKLLCKLCQTSRPQQ